MFNGWNLFACEAERESLWPATNSCKRGRLLPGFWLGRSSIWPPDVDCNYAPSSSSDTTKAVLTEPSCKPPQAIHCGDHMYIRTGGTNNSHTFYEVSKDNFNLQKMYTGNEALSTHDQTWTCVDGRLLVEWAGKVYLAPPWQLLFTGTANDTFSTPTYIRLANRGGGNWCFLVNQPNVLLCWTFSTDNQVHSQPAKGSPAVPKGGVHVEVHQVPYAHSAGGFAILSGSVGPSIILMLSDSNDSPQTYMVQFHNNTFRRLPKQWTALQLPDSTKARTFPLVSVASHNNKQKTVVLFESPTKHRTLMQMQCAANAILKVMCFDVDAPTSLKGIKDPSLVQKQTVCFASTTTSQQTVHNLSPAKRKVLLKHTHLFTSPLLMVDCAADTPEVTPVFPSLPVYFDAVKCCGKAVYWLGLNKVTSMLQLFRTHNGKTVDSLLGWEQNGNSLPEVLLQCVEHPEIGPHIAFYVKRDATLYILQPNTNQLRLITFTGDVGKKVDTAAGALLHDGGVVLARQGS